jgi:hydrogenase small subunit
MGRMIGPDDGFYAEMLHRGISRRSFIKFCAAMTAVLALPATYAPQIAAAVATAPRIPVIWLRGQDCAGNTGAFLRASHPTAAELVLDLLSVEYHQTIMAPSGTAAELSRIKTMEAYPNGYIAIVEGAIPTADDGVYCTVGGRVFKDVVREVCDGALATIAVGSCAFDGGTPAAAGGSTGAVGVADVVPGALLINLPGCPLNVENLTATIVHYLTFKQFPVTDGRHRPLFAYGGLLHNQCERRAHFEFGEFALSWGDEASQKGWCLYKLGCKGPETFANCPSAKYAEGTSWPVKAGHGCIGCTMPRFWDAMGAPYRRLPAPLPFAPHVTADHVGQALVGGVAALTVAHGAASYVRQRRIGAQERRAALAVPADDLMPPGPAGVEAEPSAALAVAADGVAPQSGPADVEPDALEPPASADASVDVSSSEVD